MRPKKTTKQPRSIRPKRVVRPGHSTHVPWTIPPQAIALGVICIVAVAAVIAARQPSHQADIASGDAPREEAVMAQRPEMKKTATVKTSTAAAAVETTPAPEPVKDMALVTITGCLEREDEAFWLKEASGADAPKSRSWRSGFLKKRPPSIKLVDATNALRLPRHVGQRVAATGTLSNRDLRASSLQRVGASCG